MTRDCVLLGICINCNNEWFPLINLSWLFKPMGRQHRPWELDYKEEWASFKDEFLPMGLTYQTNRRDDQVTFRSWVGEEDSNGIKHNLKKIKYKKWVLFEPY